MLADEKGRSRTPEIRSLNLDDLDVEELEQRLELAADASCDCWGNGCSTYCTSPSQPT